MKEAFHLLNKYELTQEFQEVIQRARESTPLRGSAYSDDYDELIEAHNKKYLVKKKYGLNYPVNFKSQSQTIF